MGGRYSKSRPDGALVNALSTSLESISTAVSMSTCENGNVPKRSTTTDTIHQPPRLAGKQAVKHLKGNTYMLLETISTASETPSLLEKRTCSKKGGGRGRGKVVEEEEEEEGRKRVEEESNKGGAERGGGGGGGRKEEERGSQVDQLTLSLPMEVERNMRSVENGRELPLGQRRSSHDNRNVRKTSPKVSPPADKSEMEKEVQHLLKSILKQSTQASEDGQVNSSDTVTPSEVPDVVFQLSNKDLDQLAMYLCSKFKDTLQTSLVKKVLQQQQREHRLAQQTKHVQISDDPVNLGATTTPDGSESPPTFEHVDGGTGRPADERPHRRRPRRPRRERPNSTPVMHWKDDLHLNLSDPQSSTSPGPARTASPSPPHHHLKTRSHSHEDCYHHKCSTSEQPMESSTQAPNRTQPACRSCREQCRNCSPTNRDHSYAGGRKKRQGRSKDTPVDVSLDDNCPGVNMVRRRHHHQHSVCENCLSGLGRSSRHYRRRAKQQHSFEMPSTGDGQLNDTEQAARGGGGGGMGEGAGFITLEQLRTLAQILKSSSAVEELPQQNGPPGNAMKSHSFRQERRHQGHAKNKRKSFHLEDHFPSSAPVKIPLGSEAESPSLSTPEELAKLQELVYPMKPRSGRDSPATDMAVVDLSIDSPCMLQPLDKREGKEQLVPTSAAFTFTNQSPDRVMHLHHHYHHIIHHGEP